MRRIASLMLLTGVLVGAGATVAVAKPPTTFNPVVEAQNYSITLQRQAIYDTPQYQRSSPPQRRELAACACRRGRRSGALLHRRPVLERRQRLRRRHPPRQLGGRTATASCGRCCSRRATARRCRGTCGRRWPGRPSGPGIVITNGSVQADEQMYWYAAQTLAKAGYVVLTFDPQGQGQSRHLRAGARPATRACRRRPTAGRSTTAPRTRSTSCSRPRASLTSRCRAAAPAPATPPSRPRACRRGSTPPTTRSGSCSTARDRAGRALLRRRRRVLHRPVGSAREGRGGAGTTSAGPGPTPGRGRQRLGGRDDRRAGLPGRSRGRGPRCRSPSPPWASRPTTACRRRPTPRCPTRAPRPRSRTAYSRAGVDSGEIIIRGGSHLDFSFIPNQAFGASLRGPDIIDWYTTRLVRQVPQARPRRRRAAAHQALAQRPGRGGDRPEPRRQRASPSTTTRGWTSTCQRRHAVRLREPARRLPGHGCSADGYPGNYSYIAIDTTP